MRRQSCCPIGSGNHSGNPRRPGGDGGDEVSVPRAARAPTCCLPGLTFYKGNRATGGVDSPHRLAVVPAAPSRTRKPSRPPVHIRAVLAPNAPAPVWALTGEP